MDKDIKCAIVFYTIKWSNYISYLILCESYTIKSYDIVGLYALVHAHNHYTSDKCLDISCIVIICTDEFNIVIGFCLHYIVAFTTSVMVVICLIVKVHLSEQISLQVQTKPYIFSEMRIVPA